MKTVKRLLTAVLIGVLVLGTFAFFVVLAACFVCVPEPTPAISEVLNLGITKMVTEFSVIGLFYVIYGGLAWVLALPSGPMTITETLLRVVGLGMLAIILVGTWVDAVIWFYALRRR